jgi:hypothetical protein
MVPPRVLFGEQDVQIAGVGRPRIAEFAPVELSAVAGVSHEAALALIGDALDLVFRSGIYASSYVYSEPWRRRFR